MNNYLINEKTVAICKDNNKIKIINVDNTIVFNINIKKLLNNNCLIYGSNLEGRRKYAQNILNIKYKIPIIISEEKKIILLQIYGLRDEDCLFIVGNKILNYKIKDNLLNIKCVNNIIFNVKISKYSFEKILINYLKLFNQLNYQNSANLL